MPRTELSSMQQSRITLAAKMAAAQLQHAREVLTEHAPGYEDDPVLVAAVLQAMSTNYLAITTANVAR